jgi:methylisocitrate lyase
MAQGGCVAAPGAADPLCARIIARAGFDALYLGGNALGLAQAKGQPFVTLTDTVEATARISRTIDAALIVDAGAGFGGLSHLAGAVREIEAAGASALHIDDQPYPKSPDYHRGRGALVSIEASAARIRAAKSSLRDPETLLIARTDALRVAKSMDEVIARGHAVRDAGADALLVLDLSPADAPRVRAALPGVSLIWIGGVNPPIPTLEELNAAGFGAALYPFNTAAAVSAAIADLWGAFKATGRVDQSEALLARMRKETLEIVDMASAWDIEDGANG